MWRIATDPGAAHPPDVAGSTRQVLTGIIDRSGVEPTATETVRAAVAGIGDLRRMAVEYEYALGIHVGDRYRIVAEQHHPGITADRAWPRVAQRLHLGEADGMRPRPSCRRPDRLGGYTDARSTAQVLVYPARPAPRPHSTTTHRPAAGGAVLAGRRPTRPPGAAVEQLPAWPVRRDGPPDQHPGRPKPTATGPAGWTGIGDHSVAGVG